MNVDKPEASTMSYMLTKTRRKWQKIADLDRRSLVDTYDVHADAELERRGYDPSTLEPKSPALRSQIATAKNPTQSDSDSPAAPAPSPGKESS